MFPCNVDVVVEVVLLVLRAPRLACWLKLHCSCAFPSFSVKSVSDDNRAVLGSLDNLFLWREGVLMAPLWQSGGRADEGSYVSFLKLLLWCGCV